jgi:uncharacterized membrane protein YedE/YeeE
VKRSLSLFGVGALFGVGLVVSGMADPRNVLGFLDFAGSWNPRLAFVMAGAIVVHFTLLWAIARRRGGRPPWARRTARIDRRLVIGSAIFGVGWGLSGYCPGPAIVSLGFGLPAAYGFVAAMIVGTLLGDAALASNRDTGSASAGCLAEE